MPGGGAASGRGRLEGRQTPARPARGPAFPPPDIGGGGDVAKAAIFHGKPSGTRHAPVSVQCERGGDLHSGPPSHCSTSLTRQVLKLVGGLDLAGYDVLGDRPHSFTRDERYGIQTRAWSDYNVLVDRPHSFTLSRYRPHDAGGPDADHQLRLAGPPSCAFPDVRDERYGTRETGLSPSRTPFLHVSRRA